MKYYSEVLDKLFDSEEELKKQEKEKEDILNTYSEKLNVLVKNLNSCNSKISDLKRERAEIVKTINDLKRSFYDSYGYNLSFFAF